MLGLSIAEKLLYTLAGSTLIFIGGWHYGATHERGKQAAVKLVEQKAVVTTVVANAEHNTAKREADDKRNVEVTDAHQAESVIVVAKRRATERVRLTVHVPAVEACAGAEAASASGPDETAGRAVVLPEHIGHDLHALEAEADECSAQLRGLQSWVRGNGFYGSAR